MPKKPAPPPKRAFVRKVPTGKKKIVRIVDSLPKNLRRIHGPKGYYKNYHVIMNYQN